MGLDDSSPSLVFFAFFFFFLRFVFDRIDGWNIALMAVYHDRISAVVTGAHATFMSHQDIETLTLFDGTCRRVNHRRAALGKFFGGLADGVLVRFLEELMRDTIFSKEVTVACFTVDSWFGKIVNVSSSLTVGAV